MKHRKKVWQQVLPRLVSLMSGALLAALCAYLYVQYLYYTHAGAGLSLDLKTFLFVSLWLLCFAFAAAMMQFQTLVQFLISRPSLSHRQQARSGNKKVKKPAPAAAATAAAAATENDEPLQLVASDVLGTVKWFDATKGYGFITSKEGTDIFVHISDMQGGSAPRQGAMVRYDVAHSFRGPKAANIVLQEPDGNTTSEEAEEASFS